MLEGVVEVARRHDLIVISDEIYDKILYDDADARLDRRASPPTCSCLTFNGLSKAYRVAGFRAGWLVDHRAEGSTRAATSRASTILANMRLCANVPGAARDPGRARRPPEHQRPGPARRPPARAARRCA